MIKAFTVDIRAGLGEKTMIIQSGFMVFRYGKQGSKPRHFHATVGEAYEEASRLALKAADEGSDDAFLILEVVGGAHVVAGKVEPLVPGDKPLSS